ncbi:MAG TPA: phosphatase PAP2 family protein [Actinomycetota bacterium]|nr:phosphatase PAP2 family protein [Actinomycetota bacterium]
MSNKKNLKKNEPAFARKLGRTGILTRQPVMWISATALMASSDKPQLRRAAGRGAACYLIGAVVGNVPKPLFNRAQPRQRKPRKPQILRGSFPSGHGAAEVAYVFGASQEAPVLFVPLGAAAAVAHWSLVRGGKHYVSDFLVGGTIGLLIALAALRLKPPATVTEFVRRAEPAGALPVRGG